MAHPRTDADIVILAGDISRPAQAIAWARDFDQPVLYVPGNHEFYGSNLRDTISQLKELARGTQIHILDNEEIMLNGVRFLGSTLWSGFNLYGKGARREQAMQQAVEMIRDFSRIGSNENPEGVLTPVEVEHLFEKNCQWLDLKLSQPYAGPTVVITHHAPSTKSVHPRFEGSLINCCFVSDSEHLMDASRTPLWIHGHTHDSFDYEVKGTRVVCNPRGYVRGDTIENIAFNPALTIDVPLQATALSPADGIATT
ncbi:metallophosphoesterase [Allopusillimonas ginsengisoli]|uniref:metallophosphoesterase n=1 Tax=Allopusillimonas ginsengisoli TaxID=453575 RepID=UPI0026D5B21A